MTEVERSFLLLLSFRERKALKLGMELSDHVKN